MTRHDTVRPVGRFAPHWRGHLFLFDSPALAPSVHVCPRLGLRLLLLFALMELVVGPRLSFLYWFRLSPPPVWIRIPLLFTSVLVILRFGLRMPLRSIGLRPWREWTATEKSYIVQVFVIANVVFATVFAARLRALTQSPDLSELLWLKIAPNVLWGAYQELMYRGILQTELVRRWGAVGGILSANVLYTFGPLHFYHFAQTPSPAPMFAAIFAIGLLFSLLFLKSHNLWLVGMMHGIGTAYIVGLRAQ